MKESLKQLTEHKAETQSPQTASEEQTDLDYSQFLSSGDGHKASTTADLIQRFGVTVPTIKCLQPRQLASTEVREDLEPECSQALIKYLAAKLTIEQQNRLRTEEQSAQVIEQLGQTITRLESSKRVSKGLSNMDMSPVLRRDFDSGDQKDTSKDNI